MFYLQPESMILLPVLSTPTRFYSNSNASFKVPKSFPIPIEGRDDFFCVDPKSFSTEQLNKYKREMLHLIDVEKTNLERIKNDSNTRINAYNQGILLAKEIIKTNSMKSENVSYTTFLPNYKSSNDSNSHLSSFSIEPIGCIDPKSLTLTQLQLYITGINEEITYEKKLIAEFESESNYRIDAYQNGIQNANSELSIRNGK